MVTFFPFSYIETLGSGTNKPILTRAMDKENNREDIVIKLMDSERMDANAALKETVGAYLALELDLNTPYPLIAEISVEFSNSLLGNSEYSRVKNSIGKNFASKNIEGLELFSAYNTLPIGLQDEALKIFYFDLLIQNPDRTTVNGKPNLFTSGKNFWILDHEIAFSFLFPIFGRPKTEPWEFTDLDKNMIENHVLYKKLKGKSLNFDILDNYLDSLNEDFWLNLSRIVPSEWLSEDFSKIAEHISSIRENQNLFINQVKLILS